MNKKNILYTSFVLLVLSLLSAYRLLSWYFQPLTHENFIKYLIQEKVLSIPYPKDISLVIEKMQRRLGLNIIINSAYHHADSTTIYTYLINTEALNDKWKPKSYNEMLKLVEDNCRAIKDRQIIYCATGLINKMDEEAIEATWAGILSHEVGHILDIDAVIKRANRLYENRVRHLISLLEQAQDLLENQATKQAFQLIAEVEQSDDKDDVRVMENLAFFYLTVQSYERAFQLYDSLANEAKSLIGETEEDYRTVLRYQSLAAHCLSALNRHLEARVLYRRIMNSKMAEDTYLEIVAEAGIRRAMHSHQIPLASGVVIVSVRPNEEGARLGLTQRDILLSINETPLHIPKDVGLFLNSRTLARIQVLKYDSNSLQIVKTTAHRLGVTLAVF